MNTGSPDTLTDRSDGSRPLSDDVYTALKEDILKWVLTPGTNLQEGQLAERFGVSRTPVREAIRRLAAEGLVTLIPQRGAVVAEVAIRDVYEAYDMREWLEPAACRLAAERMSDKAIASLEALLNDLPESRPSPERLERVLSVDRQLHNAVLEAAGNRLLMQVVDDMRNRTTRVQFLVPMGRAALSQEEHWRIVAALRDRNPDEAEAAMRDHLRRAKARLIT
jgi:DNA-binding GntR family transcriptional regulator